MIPPFMVYCVAVFPRISEPTFCVTSWTEHGLPFAVLQFACIEPFIHPFAAQLLDESLKVVVPPVVTVPEAYVVPSFVS